MLTNPLVTCLCLTRNRRNWLPQAIDNYLLQTYAKKELLLVADQESDIADLVPFDRNIRALILDDYKVVGVKRNLGCEFARGELVAIWDDDDYSAPGRLAQQVEQLQRTGKALTGYRSMKFTDGQNWWLYRGAPGFAMATSLCFRRAWWEQHHFDPIQCGQDEAFTFQAARAGQLAECDDLELMYATVHPSNTSPRKLGLCPYIPLPGYQWKQPAKEVAA